MIVDNNIDHAAHIVRNCLDWIFKMNKHSFIDDLMNLYDQPEIRSLIQLIPAGIGSALDVALINKIQEIRKDRLKSFFDELARGSIELTNELISSEIFYIVIFQPLKQLLIHADVKK